jgi:hypothetical protein
MKYGNSEHVPIIEIPNDGTDIVILEKIPPPSLHLKLGAVNALIKVLETCHPD